MTKREEREREKQEAFGSYQFRTITEKEATRVVFNDGDLAVALQITGDGLFAVGQMREPSVEQNAFVKVLPVVNEDAFLRSIAQTAANYLYDVLLSAGMGR